MRRWLMRRRELRNMIMYAAGGGVGEVLMMRSKDSLLIRHMHHHIHHQRDTAEDQDMIPAA